MICNRCGKHVDEKRKAVLTCQFGPCKVETFNDKTEPVYIPWGDVLISDICDDCAIDFKSWFYQPRASSQKLQPYL